MNKKVIIILCVCLGIILAISIFIYINREEDSKDIDYINVLDNMEQELDNDTIEIVSEEEKTTPNTIIILEKEYLDCGHTITKEMDITTDLVNLTEEELQDKYPNWTIEKFSKDEIILKISVDSFCGEHFLLLEEEGYINVYMVDEEENYILNQETGISVEYLPETDRINLRSGIMVYGIDSLNMILEDFDS